VACEDDTTHVHVKQNNQFFKPAQSSFQVLQNLNPVECFLTLSTNSVQLCFELSQLVIPNGCHGF